ncbi:MAG: sulfatase [Rikenellaceae bacterium]
MISRNLMITALGSLSVISVSAAKQKPNILFCIADDASMWTLGAYGGTFAKTPAIDKLAQEGAIFENAFTQNPKSAPSRATLVTGMHSWQLKEATNHFCHFPAEFKFYPHILMENGYHVGLTGKGWGPGVYETEHNPAGPLYNEVKLKAPYKGINTIDYAANFEKFLDANDKKEPFCFWLGAYEPHRSYEQDSWKKEGLKTLESVTPRACMPDNEIVRGDMLDYAIEVEWYDMHIGRAVKALEDRGLLKNTLIIITSDHGMPFPRVKAQLYDEGFHVPFIVYWNGVIKAGTKIEDFIAFSDVAPTLMEVAGLKPDAQMSGSSFLDVLKAKKSGQIDASRDHVLLCKERHDVGRASEDGVDLAYPARGIRNADYLYVKNYRSDRWPAGNPEYGYKNCDASPTKTYLLSLRPADSDYIYYQMAFDKRPEEQLFDMKTDPDCINNLAYDAKYASIKKELCAQMEKELKESGDPRMFGNGEIFETYPYQGKACDYQNPYNLVPTAKKK